MDEPSSNTGMVQITKNIAMKGFILFFSIIYQLDFFRLLNTSQFSIQKILLNLFEK